jgi:hypothetical protein
VIGPGSHPLKNIVLGVGESGRLGWRRQWLPRMIVGWHDLKRDMHPLKIRWVWVLLLAVVLILTMGECGPAASLSLIASLP